MVETIGVSQFACQQFTEAGILGELITTPLSENSISPRTALAVHQGKVPASYDQNIPVRSLSNEELRILEFGRTQWKSVFCGGLLLSLAAAKESALRWRRGSRPRAPMSP